MHILTLIAAIAIIVAADQFTGKVVRVIDGDTFVLNLHGNETSVRLIGVDTPETVHPSKPVEHFGKEASEFTRMWLEGRNVSLEFDPAQGYDKYDRLLAYIRLEYGTDFNLKLIQKCYAHAYTVFPHPRLEKYRVAEKQAREGGRGLQAE